jgi:large subunit ribosomal protein L6
MAKFDITEIIEIPEGIEISLNGRVMTAKGPKGECSKDLISPIVKIKVEEKKIILEVTKATKREKRLINTARAHVRNIIKGVTEGYVYKLKICSGHFPMSVNMEGDKITVKNFLGEKIPRHARLLEGSKVEIKGDEIIVSSTNIELAGQTAVNIERSTRITNRDRRRFQDGIFIIQKAGVEV